MPVLFLEAQHTRRAFNYRFRLNQSVRLRRRNLTSRHVISHQLSQPVCSTNTPSILLLHLLIYFYTIMLSYIQHIIYCHFRLFKTSLFNKHTIDYIVTHFYVLLCYYYVIMYCYFRLFRTSLFNRHSIDCIEYMIYCLCI